MTLLAKCCCPTDVIVMPPCLGLQPKIVAYINCSEQFNVLRMRVQFQGDCTGFPADAFDAMMVVDTLGEDEVTFVRVRSTDPDLSISMTVQRFTSWPYSHGPGSVYLCDASVDPDDPRGPKRMFWLISSITFTGTSGSISYTRPEDVDDEFQELLPDDDFDCCALITHVGTTFTRRLFLMDGFESKTFTVTQSDVVAGVNVAGGSCSDFDCDNRNTTIVLTANPTSGYGWDGYYVHADFQLAHEDAAAYGDCWNASPPPDTYPNLTGGLWGSLSVGDGNCFAAANFTADVTCISGETRFCIGGVSGGSAYLTPCNDKHPLYDPITAEEWIAGPYSGTQYYCDFTGSTLEISED